MRNVRSLLIGLVVLASGCGPDVEPQATASGAEESASVAPIDELAAIAWWETQNLGFGVIPEMPDPDPPVQPMGYRQLAVGTLDGRVTAVLALHREWAHSSVTGPYGDSVLVANDTGTASEVFTLSATHGSRTDLFVSDHIVAAAAIGDDGASVYYVELDRDTLRDSGLWRRPLAGGAAEQVVARRLGEDVEEGPAMFWITADPLDGRVVVQWCFGGVRCTSYLVDPASGASVERTEIGWPLGTDATTFFGDGLASNTSVSAWNVVNDRVEPVSHARRSVPVRAGGRWMFVRDEAEVPEGRTVVVGPDGTEHPIRGQDPPMTTIATLGEQHGVVLPAGWVLRWPMHMFFMVEDKIPEAHGQLIDISGGTRVDLEPPRLAVTHGAQCAILAPAEMPSGQRVGAGVLELLDGRRTVRWGSGDNTVLLAVGWNGSGNTNTDGEPVKVRRNDARLISSGREADADVALVWEEDGCEYTAWQPPGTSLDAARDYAARY